MIFLPLCFFRQMVSTPGYQPFADWWYQALSALKPDGLINIIFEADSPPPPHPLDSALLEDRSESTTANKS